MEEIFLCRDGAVLAEKGHVATPDAVERLPGAADAVRGFKEAGGAVFRVANPDDYGGRAGRHQSAPDRGAARPQAGSFK